LTSTSSNNLKLPVSSGFSDKQSEKPTNDSAPIAPSVCPSLSQDWPLLSSAPSTYALLHNIIDHQNRTSAPTFSGNATGSLTYVPSPRLLRVRCHRIN
jgi:hypothetical protein